MALTRVALLASAAAAVCQAATVIGLVVDANTLQPVRKAEVTLATAGAEPRYALALTDASGQFRFDGLPAGRYRLGAALEGFLPVAPAVRMDLAAGEVRAGVVLKLQRWAVISGQVLDAEGDPIGMATVRVLRQAYRRGKPQWTPANGTRTDGRGRYRLDRLTAGTYRVMAQAGFSGLQPTSPVVSAQQPAMQYGYGAQFFPAADSVEGAAPVVVRPGSEVTGIDFHLPFRPRATLVFTVAGLPQDAARDTVVQINARMRTALYSQMFGIGAHPGQPARWSNVDSGSYLVAASATVEGQTYCALQPLEVAGGDVPVSLTLQPGMDLPGTVRVEGGEAGKLRVNLVAGDNRGLWPQPGAAVNADGQFVLRGVPPGLWDIDVQPVPAGGYIKSMLLGDQDVLTEDMVIGPESKGPLNIVLSARGARLEGEVQDVPPDGPPPVVVVAPQGRYARVLGFFASTRADENGHFEFKGLRPGDYRVYALDDLDRDQWENPDYLAPYAARAEAVELREGVSANVKPHLISLAGGAGQ